MGTKIKPKTNSYEDWIQTACTVGEWLMLGHLHAGNISLLKWSQEESQYQWHLTNFTTMGSNHGGRDLSNTITKLFWFGEALQIDEGQLFTVWSIYNNMRVQRYSIPIA
jgi:hypothetical protein